MLSKYQSGFRPKHSTMSALIQMCDQWLENMDNGMLNCVVFLDIRKAFGSIDHSILLKKMREQFGIHGAELKWFESYLTIVRSLSGKNWQDLYKADKVSISFPATPKSN